MSFNNEEIQEAIRVLQVSRDVYDHRIGALDTTDDAIMETLRKHFVDLDNTCLIVESGPDESVGKHLVAAFGMKMRFLRPDKIYELADRTKVELVPTRKGRKMMDIDTIFKTGHHPQNGSEPPKRIINVRRLA